MRRARRERALSRETARIWLSERRRSALSLAFALLVAALAFVFGDDVLSLASVDGGVLVLLAYLVGYLVVTVAAFGAATSEQIRDWARRESRGTFVQRYVLGTAPGPGVSIFIAAAALAVAVVWMPGLGGESLPAGMRVGVAVALVVVAWICVLVSFAIAYHADNVVEAGKAMRFPGDGAAEWSDYLYFAVSVMTTFGTTDVDVVSREMRRTVTTHAIIAFVFNTVTVAAVVSALNSG
ncbi:DUF1345 domain-containing protein [Amycolatopsis keratiniphila]|uniref:DUF1345 domain-containing protein n=1 Tax=Amycolatopsis keratiniphila subsp. keratiniphila TaxID=227715 RepID=A0A1W2LKJ3_9PSEU|nr:DUF1345 domain-containing protein [Amycolatopsis keratiniphila]ONF63399.1 hypothetical protein AVR91_0233125 [Amycolatopsis keratiniphila subsp. keratiniphila]